MLESTHILGRVLTKCRMPRATIFAAAIPLALVSMPIAAGLVTDWDYQTNARFVKDSIKMTGVGSEWETGDPKGVKKVLTSDGTWNTAWGVLWGCGIPSSSNSCTNPFDQTGQSDNSLFNNSAVTIGSGTDDTRGGGGAAEGSLVLDGAYGEGSNITHWNNTIWSGYKDLKRGTIAIDLKLTPGDGSNQVFDLDLSFSFDFIESANAGINGVCYDGSPGGACPDLFRIAESDALSLMNQSFVYDNNRYFYSILVTDGSNGASPIGRLEDGECSVRSNGQLAGCRGWRTAEKEATTVQFAVRITSTPIPVPTPIALLGLGFLAMLQAPKRRRLA